MPGNTTFRGEHGEEHTGLVVVLGYRPSENVSVAPEEALVRIICPAADLYTLGLDLEHSRVAICVQGLGGVQNGLDTELEHVIGRDGDILIHGPRKKLQPYLSLLLAFRTESPLPINSDNIKSVVKYCGEVIVER
jgi:hypothetical protein